MALRTVRTDGDPVLGKKCKEVKSMTPRLKTLVEDMMETMYEENGVGLAAPQVGVLRRIVVIDCSSEEQPDDGPFVLINPVIVAREGEQTGDEGCLSVPGYMGLVDRPYKIRIKGTDLQGEEHEYEFEGFEATVFCHEYDHLDGILYSDIAKDMMTVEEYSEILHELQELHADDDEESDNAEIWEKKKEKERSNQ